MITLAVDCMGGDAGIRVTLPACKKFLDSHPDAHLLMVGQAEALQSFQHARATIVHASEVVTMDDPVEVALRRKKDSSMRVAIAQVKSGAALAAVSAGNTGALMAIARYVLKTLDGIDRPAIASQIPQAKGGATTVLDLGANVDCTAEHLLQFAIMGAALSQAVDHRESPTVGLLNIGEEVIKGNEVVKEAAELLRGSPLNFYGNVEGNDIFKGTVDVVVCDGFVGNVVLKSVEGLAKMLSSIIHEEFKRNIFTLLAGAIAKPVLNRLRNRVDNRRYNGAALLGLRGVVIKSHGSADVYAYGFALQRAREAVVSKLLERTAQTVAQITKRVQSEEGAVTPPANVAGDTA